MDFIYSADHALPDSLCEQLIDVLETHPGAQPGITSNGVNPAKKSSIDLTIDNFEDLRGVRQQILNTCFEDLADYFVRYPFVGSVSPTIRNSQTGMATELTMDNIASVSRDTVKMLIARLFRCGVINIQKYAAGSGGYPHWHSEIWAEETFEGLHRLVLWMYYLNDVESGGETEFYFQKKKIRPKKGTVVIAPAGFTHTHRGHVPLSGDKYIITSWLLYNRGGKPLGIT
ncbi:MAG: 2OG-Fe(II) oxygenase [Gammaproteobacteria bacterium]